MKDILEMVQRLRLIAIDITNCEYYGEDDSVLGNLVPADIVNALDDLTSELKAKLAEIEKQSPAVAVPEEETNFCALKSITDSQVNAVARAFWRRIYAYRNDYGIELPKPLPVEFMAHMATALTWVDKEPSTRITEQDAREICKSFSNYYSAIDLEKEYFRGWFVHEGIPLLAKLNEAKNV